MIFDGNSNVDHAALEEALAGLRHFLESTPRRLDAAEDFFGSGQVAYAMISEEVGR